MSGRTERRPRLDLEAAEAIAAQGLAFLAEDPARLSRFLHLTGLSIDDIMARAASRELLAAVLEHLSADESLLLTFAATAQLPPQSIGSALMLLQSDHAPGG